MFRIIASIVSSFFLLSSAWAYDVDWSGFVKLNNEISAKPYIVEGKAPTVLVVHGSGGVRGWREDQRAMDKWARIINTWGYNAVVVDLFSGRGFSTLLKDGHKVPFDTRANDLKLIASYVTQQQWHTGYIGLIGFSQGGATIIALSKNSHPIFKAGVVYYPACAYQSPTDRPEFHIQMHLGLMDDLSYPFLCHVVDTSKYDISKYEQTTHAFDVDAPTRVIQGHRFQYNREAYELAKGRTKVFFDNHLKINKMVDK